ncbi:MAG: transglutaminase domain-containing protein [Fibrobacter sp.]|nr:transglutaminase domain-containing protein [Fibrobacter sp.]
MRIKKIFCFLFFSSLISTAFCGGFTEKSWRKLQINDTLDVLLNGQHAGVLYGSLSVVKGTIENTTHLITQTPEPAGNMQVAVEIIEKRTYNLNGGLISAYQELKSISGRNFWTLEKSGKSPWTLLVNAGGVETRKEVTNVKDRLTSIYTIYSGVLNGSLKGGETWEDTSFELTSGENVLITTRCEETPSEANNYSWKFSSKNSVNNIHEIWTLDKKGRTLSRDMYPFKAIKSGIIQKNEQGTAINLFEAFNIAVPRRAQSNETISLKLDSCDLDTSVLFFYKKSDGVYYLNRLPQKCVDGASLAEIPDSVKNFLIPTPTLQTTQPEIIELAEKLKGTMKPGCAMVQTFNDYVYKNINKRNTATFSSALETLKSGFGDCGEHSVLLAALLRAAGIPARVIMGLVYVGPKGGYYYHAWVMAYTGSWIFADPSHGVFPAGFDRVPLIIDDSGDKLVLLSKVLGRIKIEHRKR